VTATASSPPLPRSVAISGASGMVGTALRRHLEGLGVRVLRLVRRPPREPLEVEWHPDEGRIERTALETAEAVVHLAGESLAGGLWTEARKRRIRESRVQGTRLLAETLADSAHPPHTLVSASAVGYYGDRGDEVLTEGSEPGTGFLADVAVEWERATVPAAHAGIRVVKTRFAIILSPSGGLLGRMLLPFRLGLGAVLGSGRQWLSWITLPDVIRVIATVLATPDLAGPVNATAPEPVTNAEFTRELGKALSRPTLLRLPAPLLEAVLGDLAREGLLASTRVLPARLDSVGFDFEHPSLAPALRALLGRGGRQRAARSDN